MIEQTLSIIKPDAVERNLENKIKAFIEKNNLKIVKSKKVKVSKEYQPYQIGFVTKGKLKIKTFGKLKW